MLCMQVMLIDTYDPEKCLLFFLYILVPYYEDNKRIFISPLSQFYFA